MRETGSFEHRCGVVTAKMSGMDIGGILFFDMMNIRYLVGFTGSDGALFVSDGTIVLLVDGRYITQAKEETSGCEIVEYRDKTDAVVGLLSERGIEKVGFESSALICETYFALSGRLSTVTFVPLSDDLTSLRAIKDREELESIRTAARIASEALTATLEEIRPGMFEIDIARLLEINMTDRGGEKLSFETIVASGKNSALPHAKPGKRKIAAGDFLVIDYGTTYQGYHSDETCTVAVGRTTQEQREIYGIVKDAHDRALDAVRSGVSCREIDRIAREWIERKGFGDNFSHGTGHGVGLDVHEAPAITMRNNDYLESGMVITIEPGIYIPDKWGVRIEDMVVVERDGCEILSCVSKKLCVL